MKQKAVEGWEDGPIPLMLNEPEAVTKMVEAVVYFLKGVVETKWALIERAAACLYVEMCGKTGHKASKIPRELAQVCARLREHGRRLEDKEARKKVVRVANSITNKLRERNALKHGTLQTEGDERNLVVEDSSKTKVWEVRPLMKGPITMCLRLKNVRIPLDRKTLLAMNKDANAMVQEMHEAYEAIGALHVTVEMRLELEDGDPTLSFEKGKVIREKFVKGNVDLAEVYQKPAVDHYECPACGKVGVKQFASQCHGFVPTKVESEHCYICNRTMNKAKPCGHIALVRRIMKGDAEASQQVGRLSLTTKQAHEMARQMVEKANEVEKGGGDTLLMEVALTPR